MKNMISLLITVSITILCADKDDKITFAFSDKIGTYETEPIKQSETLKDMLLDMDPSKDPIPLKQIDKESFDTLYTLMKKESIEDIRKQITAISPEKIKSFVEIANFLNIPKLLPLLTERLINLITQRTSLQSFALNPKTFLAQFSGDILYTIAQEFYNNATTQEEIWKAIFSQDPFEFSVQKQPISDIAISPYSNYLALSHARDSISLFDIPTKKVIKTFRYNIPHTSIYATHFSPDNKQLAVAYADHKIAFWNITTGKIEGTPIASHIRYDRSLNVRILLFSHDNAYLFWTRDNTIKIIDTKTGALSKEIFDPATVFRTLACSENMLAAASYSGQIFLWDTSKFQLLKTIQLNTSSGVTTLSFSKDARLIAAGCSDGRIHIYSVEDAKFIRTIVEQPTKSYTIHIQSLAFSPDNRFIVSNVYFDGLKVWNLSTGELIRILQKKNATGRSLFSHNGDFFISSSNPVLNIWDLSIAKKALPPEVLILLYLLHSPKKIGLNIKELESLIETSTHQIEDSNLQKTMRNYLFAQLKRSKPLTLLEKIFKKKR